MPWPNYILDPAAGGGHDFTDIVSAEAGIQADWGANQDGSIEVTLECRSGFDVHGSTIVFDGFSPSPTAASKFIVRAAEGHENGAVIGQGYRMACSAGWTNGFSLNLNHNEFIGIQFEEASGNIDSFIVSPFDSQGLALRDSTIYVPQNTDRSASFYRGFQGNASVIENCLFFTNSSMLAFEITNGGTITNCTAVNQGGRTSTGLVNPGGTIVNNTVIVGYSTCFGSNAYTTSSDNASSDTTASDRGIGTVTGVDFTTAGVDFVDPTTNDYNPQPTGLLDGSGSSPPLLSTDAAGNPRNDPDDIGCLAIVSGVGPIEVQLTQAVEVDTGRPWSVQNPNAVQLTQSAEVDTALPWVIGGVYFNGPDIVSQTGAQNQVFTFNENGEGTVDSRFTPATTTYLLSPDSGPLPAGLSVNATTGNLEGTPTEVGTFSNIIIRGSDGQTGFSPEVQAVLTRMSSLSQTEIDAIEAFVDGLVADGIWQNLDEFYCFALNATDWLTGWKAFTATTSGNVTRTANGGSCNNDESHIDTGIDLSTLTHYQATDCGIGAFVHTVPSATTLNRDGFGVADATSSVRWRHRGSDTNDSDCTLNGTMAIRVAQPVPISGEFASMNDDGATVRVYIDAVEVGSDTTDGVIPSGQNCYIFRWNNNGTPDRPSITGTVITDFYVGAQVNVTQMLSRLQALHTALGVVI